jgi:hypothetical protein
VRTCIDRTRPRPDSVRGKQPIHPLRAHSKTWRAAGCSWRSKYSGWKAKEFPCLKPKNNGIADAGNCNHSDRRARNRLRSPQVGVSPRPLTTTTATSVLIAHSPTPRVSRERRTFHGSKVAKRTDSYSGCGRIAFARCRQTADRHSTDLPPSQPRPRWPFGGAFLSKGF